MEQQDREAQRAGGLQCEWDGWAMSPYQATWGVSALPWELLRVLLEGLSLLGGCDSPLVPQGILTLPCVEAAVGHGVRWLSCGPIKALLLSSVVGSAEGLEGNSLLQERRMMRMTK